MNRGNISLLEEAQKELNDILIENESWKATLPFFDVVGYDECVDLFQFTAKKFKRRKFDSILTSKIRFNRNKYPTTPEGFKKLTKNIQSAAKAQFTQLNLNESCGVLTCFCYFTAKNK